MRRILLPAALLLTTLLLAPAALAHATGPGAGDHGTVTLFEDAGHSDGCDLAIHAEGLPVQRGQLEIVLSSNGELLHRGSFEAQSSNARGWTFDGHVATDPFTDVHAVLFWSDASGDHSVRSDRIAAQQCMTANFANVKGNEWWVQSDVHSNQVVSAVSVRVDGGEWVPLSKRSWGTNAWAGSVHAPTGSIVRLQARSTAGELVLSPCFRWPSATDASCDRRVTFDHRGGNEWWVESRIGGATPTKVEARDGDSDWTPLTLRSWGNWAGSFRIEPGNDVSFRALVDGAWWTSCWFSHPAGVPRTGGAETCEGGTGGGAVTFRDVRCDEWWTEARVAADRPVGGVDVRVNGGEWTPMTYRWWGAWATSVHVPDGALLQLRARSTAGDVAFHHGGWRCHEAAPYPEQQATQAVAYHNVGGHTWWQQVNVYSNKPIARVEVRIDDGPWRPMTQRSWGDWASNLHAPDGSAVQFRTWFGCCVSSASTTYRWLPAG